MLERSQRCSTLTSLSWSRERDGAAGAMPSSGHRNYGMCCNRGGQAGRRAAGRGSLLARRLPTCAARAPRSNLATHLSVNRVVLAGMKPATAGRVQGGSRRRSAWVGKRKGV